MPGNLLLDAMPLGVKSACLARGERFRFAEGSMLPGQYLDGREVLIVTGGVLSMMQRSTTGRISEVAMLGREGMFPVSALLNVPTKQMILVAQIDDLVGVRLGADEFHAIVGPDAEAALLVRKFIYSLMIQIASSVLSSEQDGVERRVARWLLMSHDRTDGDEVYVTHEMLGQMAFSHRPTVTNVLRDLKKRGLIDTNRGSVIIVDRTELRQIAGGTYGHAEDYWREHIAPFGKDEPLVDEAISSFPRAIAR